MEDDAKSMDRITSQRAVLLKKVCTLNRSAVGGKHSSDGGLQYRHLDFVTFSHLASISSAIFWRGSRWFVLVVLAFLSLSCQSCVSPAWCLRFFVLQKEECMHKIRELGSLPADAFEKYQNMNTKKVGL